MTRKIIFPMLLALFISPALFAANPTPLARSEGYRAVKDILHQEARVDGILKIKHPKKGIEDFLKQVATVSKGLDESFDGWFKEEPALLAKRDGFPAVEEKTRSDMTSSMTKSLIFSGGKNFEIRILVSQVQATDYLSHAFAVLEDAESSDARKGKLKKAKEEYEKLTGEAFVLLGAKK